MQSGRRGLGDLPMISLQEARARVMGICPVLPAEQVRTVDSIGRVLASAALANVAVPPFANSAMDGYALRASDVGSVPCRLEVVGALLAGSGERVAVGPGQAVRIMTGAPVPEGADAVCMVESTRAEGDWVTVLEPVSNGQNIRPVGDDVKAGEVVCEAGAMVGPTQLAALISAGVDEVSAFKRPEVGVVSTGDELVEPGEELGYGRIYDSNRPMLLAMVAEAGCRPVDLGHVGDDEAEIAAILEAASQSVDAVVLSGGVSVGDVDLVRVVLSRLGGGTAEVMQIAIRPAKPFSCAVLDGRVPAFGLPGNPVSAAVSFELLVRPALLKMAGHRSTERPTVLARAADALRRKPDGKTHFVRVRLEALQDGGFSAHPVQGQGSHQVTSLAGADGLAILADGTGLDQGATVEVLVTREPALWG
jgi:molybdopterin molybdotransferase